MQRELVLRAAGHQRVEQLAVLVELRVGLRDDVVAFLDRRQEVDLVGDLAVRHLAIRRLEEAVLVGARVERERVDQADVRAFGRLDRAHAAVVRRVHVAHLEPGALAGQAARAERGHAPLVRDLGQRVRLVHELAQLRGSEELLDRRGDRLGVDQVVRHQVVALGLRQALLDRALDAHQPGAELVLRQLADRTHATVAEVVDVVDLAAAVAQLDEHRDDREKVVVGERRRSFDALGPDALVEPLEPGRRALVHLVRIGAAVELHAAHRRQVVALLGVEQPVEQRLDRVLRRRLAGPHHAVDRDARRPLVGGLVGAQRLRDVGALVEVVGVQGLERGDAGLAQLGEHLVGDLVVGAGEDLAGLRVDHVVRQRAADHEVVGHHDALHARGFHVADVLDRDALVLGDDDLAGLVDDVEARHLAAQALGHQLELRRRSLSMWKRVEVEELPQDLLRRHADRLEQDRHRHLAPAVDAEIEVVLRVELEVEPGAAVGNHARREQQLARAVRLAAVVLEEHARRAVQLGDDDALGAVDDERAGGGHERDLAHVHLLLLHFLDGRLGRLLVHDDEAHLGAQRAGVGQAALLALLDVERRLAEREADELQPRVAANGWLIGKIEVNAACSPSFLRALRRHVRLQERGVGLELRREQERHLLHRGALGEALADALTSRSTSMGRSWMLRLRKTVVRGQERGGRGGRLAAAPRWLAGLPSKRRRAGGPGRSVWPPRRIAELPFTSSPPWRRRR